MPASVSLHQLSHSTPDNQSLFIGLDLSFGPGRTSLIGRNGTENPPCCASLPA